MIIGHGRGGVQSVPSVERGEVYNFDKFVPSFSLPTIGQINYTTLETSPDFDVRLISLMRTFFLLGVDGDLSSKVELFLSNSVSSGGFTITPGTGTIVSGSNLNGAKINEVMNAIVKSNPTIVSLPSGNSTYGQLAENKNFFFEKYLIIPAGVNIIMKSTLTNNLGTPFNLEYYSELFLTESPK